MEHQNRNILKDFFHSFYRIDRYLSFSKQETKKTISYGFFVAFLVSLLLTIQLFFAVNEIVKPVKNFLKPEIPSFSLKDGELRFADEKNMPYRFSVKDTSVIIDTRDVMEIPNIKDKKKTVYIGRNQMIYSHTNEVSTLPFSKIEEFQIAKKDVRRWISKIYWIVPIYLVFIFTFMIFTIFVKGLITALLSLIINKKMKTNSSFSSLYNLSIYASTGVMVLQVMTFFSIGIPFFIYYPICLLYIYFALKRSLK